MDHSSDVGADELALRVGRLVAAQRKAQGLTSAELAERSGLSRTIVSRIERGEGNPSIGTLWRLSRTLHVSLGDLLGDPAGPRTRLIRAGAGEAIGDPSGMVGRLLHADRREHRTEIYAIELPVGGARESAAHYPGVEELIVIASGSASVGPRENEAATSGVLGPGDALWFAADVPHGYATVGEQPCTLICCMLYPPAGG